MGQASWPKSSRKGIGIYTPTRLLLRLPLPAAAGLILGAIEADGKGDRSAAAEQNLLATWKEEGARHRRIRQDGGIGEASLDSASASRRASTPRSHRPLTLGVGTRAPPLRGATVLVGRQSAAALCACNWSHRHHKARGGIAEKHDTFNHGGAREGQRRRGGRCGPCEGRAVQSETSW